MAAMNLMRLRELLRAEFPRIIRFGFVGVALLVASIGLYALISRVIWPDGPKTVEYAFVTVVMTWINYEVNGRFTFRFAGRGVRSMARFAAVAVAALGINNVVFWIGHDILHILDFWVIIVGGFIVAAFTFTSHRLFTFREKK